MIVHSRSAKDENPIHRKERLWASVQDVVRAIETHPFITGLVDGSLPMDSFKFYIVQDSLYLREFARAVLMASAKSRNAVERDTFLKHVLDASKVEEALHAFFLRRWGIRLEDQEMSPVNRAYTSFLLAIAYSGSYPEVIASILPCYWVYMHVGKLLIRKGSPVEEYSKWISTYGGEEYERGVNWLIQLVDELEVSQEEERRMMDHFRLATIYEYLFWDSALRRETFPFKVNI